MKSKKPVHTLNRIYPLLFALLVIAVAAGLTYQFTKSKNPTAITVKQSGSTKTRGATTIPSSSSSVSTLPYQAPVINPVSNVPGGVTPSNSNLTLAAPEGTFVNNHGSSSYPVTSNTEELSTCNVTPGATCQIKFTQGGQTETLPIEQSSTESTKAGLAAGTVSWSWTPNQIGLTYGEWQINATSTFNGQSRSSSDSTELTISQ